MAKTAQFLSKHRNLILWRQPPVQAYNALGQPQGLTQAGVSYQFSDGRLTLTEGQDLLADGPLEGGQPTVQDAVAWIRAQPEYNMTGIVGGFTEEGREPGRVPEPDDEMDAIGDAQVNLDAEALQRVLDAERAGYQRRVVLVAAERALERVQEAAEALRAEQASAAGPVGGGTDGNAAGDDLDGLDMAGLRAAGAEFGLTFKPGTTKVNAAQAIRAARASAQE